MSTLIQRNMSRSRNGSVEVMRFIAAAGIAWFHAQGPGQLLSYSALTFFIVLMVVLPLKSAMTASISVVVWQRADRLLRPWLVWSGIFAALKVGQALVDERPIVSEFDWSMLLTGTHIHLWFLPFGFLCSILVFGTLRLVNESSPIIFPLVILLAILCVPASTWALSFNLSEPIPQWSYGLPAVFFGISIHFAGENRRKILCVSAATLVACLIGFLISNSFLGHASFYLGVNIAILVLTFEMKSRSWMQIMGTLSMPVYLIHPIFISIMEKLPGPDNSVVTALGSITLSTLLGYAIIRSRWSAILL